MSVKLIRGMIEKPAALPLQSALEEKGAKITGSNGIKTFFSAYRVPIGIEIEVENFDEKLWPNAIYWKVDEDGSLRDHGKELISKPIAGKNIDYALLELELCMRNQHPRWTHRCSVHVHINVRNWTIEQARAMVATYAVFEPLFFSLVPEDRMANGFAYPQNDICPDAIAFGYPDGKYCALNIGSSIKKYGTVEFRQHHGTADRTMLRRWIQLIVKLHNFVRRTPPREIKATIDQLNTNSQYNQFLDSVFGQTAAVFPPLVLQRAMEDGVLWAKVYLGGDE